MVWFTGSTALSPFFLMDEFRKTRWKVPRNCCSTQDDEKNVLKMYEPQAQLQMGTMYGIYFSIGHMCCSAIVQKVTDTLLDKTPFTACKIKVLQN
jgi:hypothetical protein